MDYNHRRANSELAALGYGKPAGQIHRKPVASRRHGLLPQPAAAEVSSDAGPSNHQHGRSQSYESPPYGGFDVGLSYGPAASAQRRRHNRYGSLVASEPRHNLFLAPSMMPRRGSESSTSSAASTGTATADSASDSSAATTPEAMSPASPSNSLLLLQSPPDSALSKGSLAAALSPPSPSRAPHHHTGSRLPARARACSQSASKRFPNTPIEASVPEEEEQAESRPTSRSRPHQRWPSHEANARVAAPASPNLHQRRQQRQQNMASPPQPVLLRLSPLPRLPADHSPDAGSRPSSAALSPRRTLKASRSMPQIRDAVGPPPSGPLPPLPAVPLLSPFVLPTPTALGFPAPPASSPGMSVRPPHPTGPPPPPPPPQSVLPVDESPCLSTSGSTKTLKASATAATITDKKPQPQPQPSPQQTPKQELYEDESRLREARAAGWEVELQRHKLLLEQFPTPQAEQQQQQQQNDQQPRLTRAHRSLGNLRARSKSLSRLAARSREDTAASAAPPLASHASALNLRGSSSSRPMMPRPSTAKSARDAGGGRLDDPLPPLPPLPPLLPHYAEVAVTPQVSVFEDDSEDEGDGDVVRKFVRNLFSRRTRSAEVPGGGGQGRETPSSAAASLSSAAASRKASVDGLAAAAMVVVGGGGGGVNVGSGGHNSRAKNYSSSSSFSVATTVGGASTVASSTSTLAPASTASSVGGGDLDDPAYLEYGASGCSPSPRTSEEQSRHGQKGPLLSRMFVRRSN